MWRREKASHTDNGAPELTEAVGNKKQGRGNEPATPNITGTLADLWRNYANYDGRARFGMRLARDERAESYPSTIVGVIKDKRYMIVGAPANKENVLLPIAKDEIWLCRLFNATTVFSFQSRVLKVGYNPAPYVHIELPKSVERRMLRKHPRAVASLAATLHWPNGDPAVIVDVSVSGVRLAVPTATQLKVGAVVPLFVDVAMLDKLFQLRLGIKITATFGASDSAYPDVHFYGAQFVDIDETATLVLHGYVQEQLAAELDRQSRAMVIEAAYEESMEAWLNKK